MSRIALLELADQIDLSADQTEMAEYVQTKAAFLSSEQDGRRRLYRIFG